MPAAGCRDVRDVWTFNGQLHELTDMVQPVPEQSTAVIPRLTKHLSAGFRTPDDVAFNDFCTTYSELAMSATDFNQFCLCQFGMHWLQPPVGVQRLGGVVCTQNLRGVHPPAGGGAK